MKSEKPFKLIAFDADDTLWVNEEFYNDAEQKLEDLVRPYLGAALLTEQLYQMETRNLSIFGYGVKGFILSMIETSIEISDQQINGRQIGNILDLGKKCFPNQFIYLKMLKQLCGIFIKNIFYY